MANNILRSLPSIDVMLRHGSLSELVSRDGRENVRDRLREALDEIRREVLRGDGLPLPEDPESLAREVSRRVRARFESRHLGRTQPVINATGVVLHTNLGRAPLSAAALTAIGEVAAGYCNLEYDLATGNRGKRGSGLDAMFGDLLGAGAAAVVNNCAAAVLLTLNTLAEGGEVIVSRGELVEIGGSFRIPDVITKSGARLREVGTTNRTRLSDYEQAINEQTKAILRVHPSNYRIIGFTEKPELCDLAALARAHNLPLFDDLGSGSLVDLAGIGISEEPTVASSLEAGATVVAFSGDKLLGGPQCGIVLGEPAIIKNIKSNPLMRALRVDKLSYAALEATIASYLRGNAQRELPALAALHATRDEVGARAEYLIDRVIAIPCEVELRLIDGFSAVGGGSAPEVQLPSVLITVSHPRLSADDIEKRLRHNSPPIIARIVDDRLTLDVRTVQPRDEAAIITALQRL